MYTMLIYFQKNAKINVSKTSLDDPIQRSIDIQVTATGNTTQSIHMLNSCTRFALFKM